MPRVIFLSEDGARTEVPVSVGTTVMQAGSGAGIEGIVGECGGNAMCATCHVVLDPDWANALPPMGQQEDALLEDMAAQRRPGSRLGCQIVLDAALDGLVIEVPGADGRVR